MSESPHKSLELKTAWSDSPWFWVMLFSAAGVMFLLAFSPKYGARQQRLEMQYYARQEITRRQVEGPGASGPEAEPPAPGELIIPLWPLVALFSASFAISAALAWRSTRRAVAPASRQGRGAEP
jgi:tryptophan-rich sensory protein